VGWFEVERPHMAADKISGPHYGHQMNASGLKESWNQHEETMPEDLSDCTRARVRIPSTPTNKARPCSLYCTVM
jgi:hypothetical protein